MWLVLFVIAAAALLRMKQQSPLESWCQMADNLTLLTSDDSSRHLIRVCKVMALESIDNENSKKKLRVTRKKFAASATPPVAASTTTSGDVSNPSISSTSERTLPVTSTASSQPQDKGADADKRETKTEPSTAEASSTGKAKKKPTKRATGRKGKTPMEEETLPGPDFESIYKYIAGLMQGEQKEIGGLESLVVLDCLKSIESHLNGRNNAEQKQFVQQHFVELLQNLYLTIDNVAHGCYGNNATTGQVKITTADLIGSERGQSQTSSDKPDQPETGSLSTSGRGVAVDSNSAAAVNQSVGAVSQSASTSGQPSQSHETLSQPSMQQTTSNKSADLKHLKVTGLGSLNPFNVPVKLLEIRKDR